jgi:hypothetical protein
MTKSKFRTLRPVITAVAMIAAAMISGCSGGGPAKAAQSYTDNLKLYNYPACYQALSHQDQIDRTIDQFLTQIPLAPNVTRDWFKGLVRAEDFTIGEAKMEGTDKAVVTVKVTHPDLALWERSIDASVDPNSGPDQVAQKNLEEKTYPKITYDDNIVTVNEGGVWKILVNFPEKDDLEKKHKEAIEAYHKHDYDKAIAAYQAAIQQCDKDEATGNAGIKFRFQKELDDINTVKSQIPDGQAYVPKLALSDVDMKMSASRVPGIFGKITNNGDKAIDEVVCTVTYYEGKAKKKKSVFSEEHSIIVTPIEFINFSRTVLPFVPSETRSFGFKLTAPPDIQQKANPDLEVSGIVFTQSKAPLPKPQAAPTPTPAAAPGAPAGAQGSPAGAPPGGGSAASEPPPPLPPPPPPPH